MALPPIPTDILAAPSALRSELIDSINALIDASQPAAIPGENNDRIIVNNFANFVDGLSGNDVIASLGGNDIVRGNFGNDYILAGDGDDKAYGGDGNDIVFGEAGNDVIFGEDGDDAIFGGLGNDALNGGTGNDWLFGNAGADRLVGGFGNDIMDGGSENDTIIGESGNDELTGATGNDRLFGGVDNDRLAGGSGADILSGGVGDDIYFYASRFHGSDRIDDFNSGQDKFEFLGVGFGVDAGTNLNDGTTFVANAAPVSVVNEATVLYETDTGRLWFDIDGTGAATAQYIGLLAGMPQLNADDFVFV
jgi:Ca2+-binding RTX toxin-like protein